MTVPDPQIVLFQNAYNDYQKLMTKHVNYKISNALNSEDLVQETYLKHGLLFPREEKSII